MGTGRTCLGWTGLRIRRGGLGEEGSEGVHGCIEMMELRWNDPQIEESSDWEKGEPYVG